MLLAYRIAPDFQQLQIVKFCIIKALSNLPIFLYYFKFYFHYQIKIICLHLHIKKIELIR